MNEIEEPCATCAEFCRGERENTVVLGVGVHACERVDEGLIRAGSCPCGCAGRRPGAIATDKMLYGNAFLRADGSRVDPHTVIGFGGL